MLLDCPLKIFLNFVEDIKIIIKINSLRLTGSFNVVRALNFAQL